MSEAIVERRLSTILAADVVGYSRLVGRDEAGTVAAIKAHIGELIEPKALQYRGRIVKLMGDGLLMEFVSVVDAVLFAVEMQGGMALRNDRLAEDDRIVFRIGINIGDIIVDGDDIHGDGVNIAARLESMAEPGGVYLSEAAFAQVQGKLDLNFESLGAQEAKNISQPISVRRVIMDDKANSRLTDIQRARRARRRPPWPCWWRAGSCSSPSAGGSPGGGSRHRRRRPRPMSRRRWRFPTSPPWWCCRWRTNRATPPRTAWRARSLRPSRPSSRAFPSSS